MHLRCDVLSYKWSKNTCNFQSSWCSPGTAQRCFSCKGRSKKLRDSSLARMSVPIGTPWPTCSVVHLSVVGGAMSGRYPKLFQNSSNKERVMFLNWNKVLYFSFTWFYMILHLSAWSQSSSHAPRNSTKARFAAPSTVKTPWLTSAAFTASTTAVGGGLPPGSESMSQRGKPTPNNPNKCTSFHIFHPHTSSLHCMNFIQLSPCLKVTNQDRPAECMGHGWNAWEQEIPLLMGSRNGRVCAASLAGANLQLRGG